MKKLVALILVLGLATMANAALTMDVSTTAALEESDTLSISISGDGTQPGGIFFLGVTAGQPGTLSVDSAVINYGGNDIGIEMFDDTDVAEALGVDNPSVYISLNDIPVPPTPPLSLDGLLVSGIIFHCEGGINTVTVTLFDGDFNPLTSVVISQIPEPMTLALLGLGGLFIRRRK